MWTACFFKIWAVNSNAYEGINFASHTTILFFFRFTKPSSSVHIPFTFLRYYIAIKKNTEPQQEDITLKTQAPRLRQSER